MGGHTMYIVAILIIAFLVMGPKRLPELGRAIGQTLYEFKATMKELMDKDHKPTP